MKYLTGRPHLTVLKEKGKTYKQAARIPAAERRAMDADPTTTTIMTMNSLFDSMDNSAPMSREVQRTRIATGTEDGQLVRRCPDSTTVSPVVGTTSILVVMSTGNNDHNCPTT